jgi:hypothetical protein
MPKRWRKRSTIGSSTVTSAVIRPHLGADRPPGAVHHQTEDHLLQVGPQILVCQSRSDEVEAVNQ